MPNSVESLGYIKCHCSSSPRPLKSPGNSIRHNCQKICSLLRRPKTILAVRGKFFKDFTTKEKKTNRAVVFSSRPFHNILKYKDHRWDHPTIWKTRLILKSSASMYESSGSQFFRTITGIQSELDAFDESRFAMTFLTILGLVLQIRS